MPNRKYAWTLAFLAPLTAALSLVVLKNVLAVFFGYQLMCCLVLPAVETLVIRRAGWSEHARVLGLRRRLKNRLTLGFVLGLATAGVVAGFLAATADLSHPADRVREAMTLWSISPRAWPWVMAFMLILHAPAEELFWRGYLQTRLVGEDRDAGDEEGGARAGAYPGAGGDDAYPGAGDDDEDDFPGAWIAPRIVLLALLYASYHAVTLATLVPSRPLAALMFGGIWGAGCFWGWLRWRTGSVWPPLLSHVGGVAAYVAFVPPM